MKKTQFIELIKNIKETVVSFISITMFIALSIAIFTGISWSSKAITSSINDVFETYKNRDVELIFPYGMNEDDIEKLSKLEGVDQIEGSYTGYAFFHLNNTKYQAKLIQIRNELEVPILCEGRLPEKENEISVSELFASQNNLHIGDTIKFDTDNGENERAIVRIYNFDLDKDDLESFTLEDEHLTGYLNTDTFVITGTTKSTEFLNVNPNTFGIALTNGIQIDCFMYLPECAFDSSSFLGYTDIIIRNDSLRKYNVYSDEYMDEVNQFSQFIKEQAANEIASDKSNELKNKINEIIANGQSKLDDAQKQIKDTEKQINDGIKELESAKKKLDDAYSQLESADKEYKAAKEELDYYATIYNETLGIYRNIVNNINNGEQYIEEHKDDILKMCNYISILADKYDYPGIKEVVTKISNYIKSGHYQLVIDTIKQYEYDINTVINKIRNVILGYYDELEGKKKQLDSAHNEYNEGLRTYENMKSKLEKASDEVNDAKKKYSESTKLLDQFEEATSIFQEYGCTTLTKGANVSYVVGQTLSEMMGKLRYSMASLFVIVGLLVCYSAISRIVNDQTTLIGTKKALGLSLKEITKYYLSYTGTCIVLGCILGNLIGYLIVQPVLVKSISTTFTVELNSCFALKDTLVICSIEIILLLLITYFACEKVIKRNAIDLLKGPEIPQGKQRFYEKFSIWNNLPLYTKTIINNCFNEKRRIFGTIVGILGSTALIVTALTLNDNILDSYDTQYKEIFFFDTIINYDENNENGKKEIIELLDKYNVNYADVLYTRMYITSDEGEIVQTFTYVPEDIEQFKNIINLNVSKDYGNKTYQGVWMCDSYRAYYNLKQDDLLNITTLSGNQIETEVSGYFDSYLTNCSTVIDKETYKNKFNSNYANNSFLISTENIDYENLSNELVKIDGYITQINHKSNAKGSFVAFESVSKALVAIYMVLAVLMAFLVILNLLIMFVNEKKRELIVLMINGFSIKQARKYIYSDTILLTIIGILLGLVVGSIVGNYSVKSFESNQTMFLHRIDPKACIIAVLVTSVLTFMVSLIALKRINKFKLTDINKV